MSPSPQIGQRKSQTINDSSTNSSTFSLTLHDLIFFLPIIPPFFVSLCSSTSPVRTFSLHNPTTSSDLIYSTPSTHKMQIRSREAEQPHRVVVPHPSAGFIAVFIFLFAQLIVLAIQKFKQWRRGKKPQPDLETGTENRESETPPRRHQHRHNEQLPAYPADEQPPPPYIERPTEAHLGR